LKAAAAESTALALLGLLGFSGSISLLRAELTTALKTGAVRVESAAWSWTAPAAGCRGLAAWAETRNITRRAAMKMRGAMVTAAGSRSTEVWNVQVA